jgi:hypothetical protein
MDKNKVSLLIANTMLQETFNCERNKYPADRSKVKSDHMMVVSLTFPVAFSKDKSDRYYPSLLEILRTSDISSISYASAHYGFGSTHKDKSCLIINIYFPLPYPSAERMKKFINPHDFVDQMALYLISGAIKKYLSDETIALSIEKSFPDPRHPFEKWLIQKIKLFKIFSGNLFSSRKKNKRSYSEYL